MLFTERMQYHWNIHLKVLYMHLHNSLAHLACYPLPRNNRCQQSSATVNVIFYQLMIKSSPSSSDVPPNSSFVAADAASNAARSNLQSLAPELRRLIAVTGSKPMSELLIGRAGEKNVAGWSDHPLRLAYICYCRRPLTSLARFTQQETTIVPEN